jgi:arylsulfatase A-like enzyme
MEMNQTNRRSFLRNTSLGTLAALSTGPWFLSPGAFAREGRRQPNIIFIMADDLGYGDLGCYGQKTIKTPCIDHMAAEGTGFTDCYAGSTVCAPSRCCLMTGYHTGHARVRGNALVPLLAEDVTVAEILKDAGYATGIVGKWGLGEPDTSGVPNRQGFDYWFGYLNQARAHNYYPDYVWKNEERYFFQRWTYSHDAFTKEALDFIQQNQNHPFFLYLTYTIPHAFNEGGKQGMQVPDDAPYSNEPWPQQSKNHAAMITRMDTDVGKLFALLKKLNLDEDTIVFFTSDNGPHREGGADPNFFDSNGPLRGIKRDLYEGGICVPMIARWPGKIAAGAVSDQVWAFWDFLPTAAELAGAQAPGGVDGISMLPALLGKPQQNHEYLYWEFHERGSHQAVRMGDWKGVRSPINGPLELYDLKNDRSETKNIADQHPEIVKKIEEIISSARTDNEHWPLQPRK